jgi:hypothetical protein
MVRTKTKVAEATRTGLVATLAYLTPDVAREVRELAKDESRRVGNMTRKLIEEALEARRESAAVGSR